MSQQQPPVLTIKMVPAGVELVLAALNKLPREQSDGLFQEIAGQASFQLQELQKAHEAEQAQAAQAQERKALVEQAAAEGNPVAQAVAANEGAEVQA